MKIMKTCGPQFLLFALLIIVWYQSILSVNFDVILLQQLHLSDYASGNETLLTKLGKPLM